MKNLRVWIAKEFGAPGKPSVYRVRAENTDVQNNWFIDSIVISEFKTLKQAQKAFPKAELSFGGQ